MKFCIVNAYGRSNRGDSVLLDECISEIRAYDNEAKISCALFYGVDEALSVYPDINWSIRIGNSRTKGILGRIETISYMMIALLSTVKCFSFLISILPKDQQTTFLSIRNVDVVVSAPGGYIHDTNFAYYVALLHIYLGILMKKKVILAPQSYGPIQSKFGRWIASHVLSKCNAVCSRELYSHNFLANELSVPNGVLRRCGDSAFFNYRENSNFPNVSDEYKKILFGEQRILGITVVGWSFPHRKNAAEDYERYVTAFARAVDEIAFRHNLKPVVFNQVDGDMSTARILQSKCKSEVYVDSVSREPELLRPLISRSFVFVGTRFHSCIFAMMEGVPTMAISYLPKTEFIMKDIGFSDKYVDINSVDVDKIVKCVSWDVENPEEARLILSEKLKLYRDKFGRLSDVFLEEV